MRISINIDEAVNSYRLDIHDWKANHTEKVNPLTAGEVCDILIRHFTELKKGLKGGFEVI